MTSHKPTAAQIKTLETILTHGGQVLQTMGKLRQPNSVRTLTILELETAGLVRVWHRGYWGHTSDIEVRAAGCLAVRQDRQGRQTGPTNAHEKSASNLM
jgi:hypothetical protein